VIAFQLEAWPDVAEEIKALALLQYEEIALDREAIPYDPDWNYYSQAHAIGRLKVVTVRHSITYPVGRLVGWYGALVMPHPHYRSTLFAFQDLCYLLPEYRRGTTAARLFVEAEHMLRAAGVKCAISISKDHMPGAAALLDRLGWRRVGVMHTKLLLP